MFEIVSQEQGVFVVSKWGIVGAAVPDRDNIIGCALYMIDRENQTVCIRFRLKRLAMLERTG